MGKGWGDDCTMKHTEGVSCCLIISRRSTSSTASWAAPRDRPCRLTGGITCCLPPPPPPRPRPVNSILTGDPRRSSTICCHYTLLRSSAAIAPRPAHAGSCARGQVDCCR